MSVMHLTISLSDQSKLQGHCRTSSSVKHFRKSPDIDFRQGKTA